MFLTQFEINTHRRESRRLLASPERIHAAMLASFPAAASQQGRILWRVDTGDHQRRELYISSPTAPDLSALVEDCGWPAAQSWRTANTEPLLERLHEGQTWRFRLTANPVKITPAHGTRGKPVPLTLSGHLPWLQTQAARAGIGIGDPTNPTAMVTRAETLKFTKAGHTVTISLSQFDGTLTVTDPNLLRTALTNGIGRAKAYGAGLLTLAPTNETHPRG